MTRLLQRGWVVCSRAERSDIPLAPLERSRRTAGGRRAERGMARVDDAVCASTLASGGAVGTSIEWSERVAGVYQVVSSATAPRTCRPLLSERRVWPRVARVLRCADAMRSGTPALLCCHFLAALVTARRLGSLRLRVSSACTSRVCIGTADLSIVDACVSRPPPPAACCCAAALDSVLLPCTPSHIARCCRHPPSHRPWRHQRHVSTERCERGVSSPAAAADCRVLPRISSQPALSAPTHSLCAPTPTPLLLPSRSTQPSPRLGCDTRAEALCDCHHKH